MVVVSVSNCFSYFVIMVVFFLLLFFWCACCVFRPSEVKCAVQRSKNKPIDNIFHTFFKIELFGLVLV